MKLRVLFSFVACALFFSSCSSIINGSRQNVSVKATPDAAKIYIDGNMVGTGTAEASLIRGKEHVVEVKLPGYETAKVTTANSITGWFWGNLICGGVIGWAVDLITGAAFDVDPNNIVVTLEKGTGMLNLPANENLGHLEVKSSDGQQLASVSIQWQ